MLDEYDTLYAPRLRHRAASFRVVFSRLLANKPSDICIVETGAINDPGNWSGHGQSTILFEKIIQAVGGKVFCVDTSLEAVKTARSIASSAQVIWGDSVKFLHLFNEPIDLLYLDSLDYEENNPIPSAKHQLFELCAAMKCLRSGSIVLVDDTWFTGDGLVGKGVFVNEYMTTIMAEKITDDTGLQMAWVLR